jgi:Tfp pilus assembly protein PilN
MNNMNFLTDKYKERLEIENYFRKYFGIFIIILLVLYTISFGIKQIENSVQRKINIEKADIANSNERIKALKEMSSQETNLGVKIEIIEDIFRENNLRLSEILKTLAMNVPENVWLQSLVYQGGEIRIKGFAFSEGEIKGSEENTYHFEEKMLDSGLYESVSLNYLRKATKYGEKINEFEYILVLKDK